MKTLLEVFKRTKEIISDKKNWCQEYGALNSFGIPISPKSPLACRFCLVGAFTMANVESGTDYSYYNLSDASVELFGKHYGAVEVNDVKGFEAVHQVLDLLIKKEIEFDDIRR